MVATINFSAVNTNIVQNRKMLEVWRSNTITVTQRDWNGQYHDWPSGLSRGTIEDFHQPPRQAQPSQPSADKYWRRIRRPMQRKKNSDSAV